MSLLNRIHTLEHAVHHALQDAVHHVMHHALHHGHHSWFHHHRRPHGVVHHPRVPILHHAAEASNFEDLEQRQMMSVTVPTPHAPVLETAAPAAVKSTPATAKATGTKGVAVKNPVAVADPAITDQSFTYRSFAADPLFGPAGPGINDVSQGELGDCYLLSVLSSVAKTHPALIRNLISANTNGTYTVTFAGKKTVTVDADLPALPSGQPAYAQLGAGNSLWVALVEKAYADFVAPKVDSYNTISGGWMGDVFTAVGVRNTAAFSAASATALATLVQKDVRAGDFVTMGTASYVGVRSPLVAGHAYEIDSVTLDKKGKVQSVTLRNPWGNDIANGGYLTVTTGQLFTAFAGLSVGRV